MIEIKEAAYPSPEQWKITIHGMRNPYNSWSRTDSFICLGTGGSRVKAIEEECKWCPYSMWYLGDDLDELLSKNDREFHGCGGLGYLWEGFFRLGEKDKTLAKNLINSGVEHAKFLRQLPVTLDIKAPLYWWKQADQYKIGTTTDSCSTMHKLTEKEFELSDFSLDYSKNTEEPEGLGTYENLFWSICLRNLNELRDKYLETKNKNYWYTLNEFLPQSYNQLRTWSGSYATLFNICAQRANHPLEEWNTFIRWIVENVPYFKELCFDKLCAVSGAFNEMFNGVKEC